MPVVWGTNPEFEAISREITRLCPEFCPALTEPRRVVLLYALAQGPRNVSALAALLGIAQPAASRHLKMLHQLGLVQSVHRGSSVEYSLVDRRLIDAFDTLRLVLREALARAAQENAETG